MDKKTTHRKSFRFRLKPTKEQAVLLDKTFGCTRFIYNQLLADSKKHYEDTQQSQINTPAMYKSEYPWLKEVDSLALANAQLNLKQAFSNFFKGLSKFPKFKSKHKSRKRYTTNCVRNNIRIEGRCIKLPKLGLVKMVYHRELPHHHQIKGATISKSATGKYYIAILTEYDEEITKQPSQKVVGLDFSMKELYVSSEGERVNFPRFYRALEKKLAQAQRGLSRKVKGSANRLKAKLKVAKLHEKIADQRRDFLHHLSTQLIRQYDVIVIEDLNMKGMSQALKFGKSVHDNGWGMFVKMLEYKALLAGKQVVKIDRFYPSSKTCSSCAHIKEDLTLSARVYHCEICGLEIDRDFNASLNIQRAGRARLAW